MATPILRLTDGVTSINLITSNGQHGIHLDDWVPVVSGYKNDGVWSDSPLADGGRIVDRQWANVNEVYDIKVDDSTQNSIIETVQDLRRLLEKAAEYWISDWQREPVWIEAKGACESNIRYSLVIIGRVPEDENPYTQPFFNDDNIVFDTLTVLIEREPFWRNIQPESSECVPLSVVENYCYPAYLEFNGDTSEVDCGTNATIADIPDNAVAGRGQITIDTWIKADSYGELNLGRIAFKNNWIFYVDIGDGLRAQINCVGQSANSSSGLDEFTADGLWHHVLMTYDETGVGTPAARTIYLAIDGVWVTSYLVQQVSIGNYITDVANDLMIGNNVISTIAFDGDIGWFRVSDIIRYTVGVNFDVPRRCTIPAMDVDTMVFVIYDGSGTTTVDLSGNNNDGTITDCEWVCCDNLYGNVLGLCGPAYVDGDGTNTVIDCGSAAKVDNIPSGDQITFECWIRPHGYFGANPVTQLAEKGSASLRGWNCAIVSTTGQLSAVVNCATTDAASATFSNVVPINDEWHHVVMVYDDTGDRKIYLAGDGVWAPSYITQNAGVGAYVADTADDLLLMNDNTGNTCFWGGMMMVRISDNIRYTPGTNFTPPTRCELLTTDSNTIWLGIHEGQGTTIYDLSATPSNGTLSSGVWGCDCHPISVYSGEILTEETREPTCNDEVYVANKHNVANISNVHWWDASATAWSLNLQDDALPTPLLPAVPGVGDVIVFGSNTALADSGPFCSLVFDLITAQQDLTITWRYSDTASASADPTAWAVLGVMDSTNQDGLETGQPFDTIGVKSACFTQRGPANPWVTRNPTIGAVVLGITGYWVAAHVTAIGAAPLAPVQQKRRIYSVVSPYIEIQSADILGDVQALTEILARSQIKNISGMQFKGIVCGLRSISRGLDFSPYFNCSAEQNRPGVTYTDTLLTADVTEQTGWKDVYANAPAFWATFGYWTIDADYAQQYWGRYHAYLRGYQVTGASGDVTMRLSVIQRTILGNVVHTSNEVEWDSPGPTTYTQEFIDFGIVTLPGGDILPDETFPIILSVEIFGDGIADTEIYDLILIPVDEWAASLDLNDNLPDRNETYKGGVFVLDGTYPKMTKRGLAVEYTTNSALESAPMITAQPPLAQANARQRLWFFYTYFSRSYPYVVTTVRMNDMNRYWSMRGNR